MYYLKKRRSLVELDEYEYKYYLIKKLMNVIIILLKKLINEIIVSSTLKNP